MILICPTHEVVKQIVEEIQQEGISIQVLDVQQLTILTEFFIIIVSEDEKQTKQIATKINKVLLNNLKMTSTHIEGLYDRYWTLLDFNDIIVHVFNREAARLYTIERLWKDAKQIIV